MASSPTFGYARPEDGAYIGYRVDGDGPIDIVWQIDWPGNIDMEWEARSPDLGSENWRVERLDRRTCRG